MITVLDSTPRSILYEVPYYPQQHVNSCWYSAAQMVMHAYDPTLNVVMPRGFERFLQFQMPNTDDSAFRFNQLNNLKALPSIAVNLPNKHVLSTVKQYLDSHGPFVAATGHAIVVCGCNIEKNTVTVHYTLPQVYQIAPDNMLRPNKTFFESLRDMDHSSPWINDDNNYRILEQISKANAGSLIFSKPEDIRRSISPDEIEQYRKTVCDCSEPMDRWERKYLINELMHMKMYTPLLVRKAAYLELSIEDFKGCFIPDTELQLGTFSINISAYSDTKAVKQAMQGMIQRTTMASYVHRALHWVPDSYSNHCQVCERNFTWFRRRHHCRSCGFLICFDCSMHKSLAASQKIRRPGRRMEEIGPVRVCSQCG